jgi:protein TonB
MRRWTAMASFTLQAALVASALAWPLLRPAMLPDAFARRPIFVPARLGDRVPVRNHPPDAHASAGATLYPIIVRTGASLHPQTNPNSGSQVSGPPDIRIPGDPNGERTLLSADNVRPLPPPSQPIAHHAPVSVFMEGNLIRRVEPRYPAIAQQVGVQGTVIIKALISRTGNIERAEVESGPALLTGAALAAVKEWKYRPYFLNGQPVEVETEITVKFLLNR